MIFNLILATGGKDCSVIIWRFDPKTLKLTNDKVGKISIIIMFIISAQQKQMFNRFV